MSSISAARPSPTTSPASSTSSASTVALPPPASLSAPAWPDRGEHRCGAACHPEVTVACLILVAQVQLVSDVRIHEPEPIVKGVRAASRPVGRQLEQFAVAPAGIVDD